MKYHWIALYRIQVEVERRKESTTDSALVKQVVGTNNRLPASISIDAPKTADKPRKGLPSFIWVIGIFYFNIYMHACI